MPRDDFPNRFATFAELEREFGGSQLLWLSPPERARLEQLRNPRRRTAWIWGRVLSKQLLIDEWNAADCSPTSLTIHSHDDNGFGIAPVVIHDGSRHPCRISISHTDRAVAVAMSSEFQIGVDLVDCAGEEFSEAACRMWFTPNELRQMTIDDSQSPRLYWAVKEAAFKACSCGEPFAPRRIEVTSNAAGSFEARCNFSRGSRICRVSIRRHKQHVIALAVLDATGFEQTPNGHITSSATNHELSSSQVVAAAGGRMS